MNCNWVKENVTLYVYEELADDARHELERHLERCADCAAELKAAREFHQAMSVVRAPEPTPNLLAASRMRLQEALETAEQSHGWARWAFDFAGWMHQMKLSPALVVVLLMFGFGAGIMATWKVASDSRTAPAIATQPSSAPAASQASIAGIRAITQEPGSKQVEIQYDTMQPQLVQGSLDDPRIQQLLLYAARNNYNSGVRMDSIDLLTQSPDDQRVREALMYALRYDNNPGVRLKALEGLQGYVRQDIRVRNAVLEALMNDANPGVRSTSISLLRPVRADSSVRQALQYLAREEKSAFIRSESRRVLSATPEID